MKAFFIISILLSTTIAAAAKPVDTVQVKSGDLDMKALQTGSYNYMLYSKASKQSPAQGVILVKINVEATAYHNRPAVIVTQQWERDTVYHSAYSVFDAKDFSTILHDSFWKRLGYSMKFDFEAKTVEFTDKGAKGGIPDSVKTIAKKDFDDSFKSFNLNWHADLIIYQLLPYKENRTFMINYYDPGFGKAEKVAYSVTGSDVLTTLKGEKADCWILEHTDVYGTERFWIAKKTKEVLMEEDKGPKGNYRYKVKFGVSGI